MSDNLSNTEKVLAPNNLHTRARGPHPAYPPKCEVLDKVVKWTQEYPEYNPTMFTHPIVLKESIKLNGWADNMDPAKIINIISSRKSYTGPINLQKIFLSLINENNEYENTPVERYVPENPEGRTGMVGRGLLGKWGPNQAADPILLYKSSLKKDDDNDGDTNETKTKTKTKFLGIKRGDTSEWAIPGGMVDYGEAVSLTLRRELEEETGNVSDEHKKERKIILDKLFTDGPHKKLVYKGYVDDPRNTDNAWMETTVVAFLCSEDVVKNLKVKAGDDAKNVDWITCDNSDNRYMNLYASHKYFVDQAIKLFS